MKYIFMLIGFFIIGCYMLFVQPVQMQTTKDYNHAGKAVGVITEEIQSEVCSVIEGYIPSASRRDHLNYIPSNENTYTLVGGTLSSNCPMYLDLTEVMQSVVDKRPDIEQLDFSVNSFFGGTLTGEVPTIDLTVNFTLKSVIKGNEVDYESRIPITVRMK